MVAEQQEAVASLIAMFDLEPLEVDLYRGANPDTWPGGRVFGGLVASQALRAAMATVEAEHHIHSFHAYFIRPGQPGVPMVFAVDRVRNGRSFTTRIVTAKQQGEATFTMTASFHRDGEEGLDYQLPRAFDVPEPDDVTDPVSGMMAQMREMAERLGPEMAEMAERMQMARSVSFFAPFDMRELGPTAPEADGTYRSTRRVWVRAAAALPDDRNLHACALTFMSDMAVVMAVRPPSSGLGWEGFTGASLDHAVWFHRPVRADEWLLYDLHSLSTFNARGLARGTFHTQAGVLGASVTQEALIRQLPPGTMPPGFPARPPEL